MTMVVSHKELEIVIGTVVRDKSHLPCRICYDDIYYDWFVSSKEGFLHGNMHPKAVHVSVFRNCRLPGCVSYLTKSWPCRKSSYKKKYSY